MGGGDGDALGRRPTLKSMNVRTTHRLAAVAGPVVVAALVLGACGGDDSSAATRATVTLAAGETDYQTIAPATTTTIVDGQVLDEFSLGPVYFLGQCFEAHFQSGEVAERDLQTPEIAAERNPYQAGKIEVLAVGIETSGQIFETFLCLSRREVDDAWQRLERRVVV